MRHSDGPKRRSLCRMYVAGGQKENQHGSGSELLLALQLHYEVTTAASSSPQPELF